MNKHNELDKKPQRVVFVNLHADWMLLTTTSVYLFKFSPAIKHGYLLRYLLDHPERYQVASLITDRGFSIYTHGSKLLRALLKPLARLEHRWILRRNGISPASVQVLTSPAQIRPDDITISYNYFGSSHLDPLRGTPGFHAHSMLHFGGSRVEGQRLADAGIDALYCEADLSKTSEIFRRCYPQVKAPWVVHPFVFADRFKCTKPFGQRKNKAFSVGTITYKHHPEFLEVYGDPCDQPVRRFVKQMRDFFADTADSYSEDYCESADEVKDIRPTDNPLIKLYKRVYNRFNSGRQKKYFSFDMVEKFNEYKMHILGEEILGVPGIGYVEGMACGSAYIGLDSPMYRDLGLIPGVHYIAYDGTPEGLRDTIRHWQLPEHQAELEAIAARGCAYVRQHFSGPAAAARLLDSLIAVKQAK